MNDSSPYDRSHHRTAPPAAAASSRDGGAALTASILVLTAVAFALYLLTAILLDLRQSQAHFGADASHYAVLADMGLNHRAARFHPLTTTMGLAWMKLVAPLTPWFAPATLLKVMFAAVGALGVWAAAWTYAALVPRGYAILGGILYGSSLGVWYFSGIPESKIVTATLSVLYIATYVRLRERWSVGGAVALSVILALACLNEIVSAFLLAIPVVDVFLRHRFDWRQYRWLFAHVPVVLVVWFVLEIFVNGWLIPESAHVEGQSHFNMLLYYIARNDYGLAAIHGFLANWFFFNLVAPTPHALWWHEAGGYFEPSMVAYLGSPLALATLLTIAVLLVGSVLPRYRATTLGPAGSLLLPLAAYALVRAAFFFVFNPSEPLLFSPAVTLPHWLILLVPFLASRFPAKRGVLAVLAVLLFATNASFVLGSDGWSMLLSRSAAP